MIKETLALQCFPPVCDSVSCAPFFMQPAPTGDWGGDQAGIIEKGKEQRKGTVSSGRRGRPNGRR